MTNIIWFYWFPQIYVTSGVLQWSETRNSQVFLKSHVLSGKLVLPGVSVTLFDSEIAGFSDSNQILGSCSKKYQVRKIIMGWGKITQLFLWSHCNIKSTPLVQLGQHYISTHEMNIQISQANVKMWCALKQPSQYR